MIAILLLIFSTWTTLLVEAETGLYSDSDDVVILSNINFDRSVLGGESAWIVEFYNSWCGHCIHFAPKWKKFAKDIKGWQKVINVGAVDCSQSQNADLCRQQDIKGYPSFKIFPPYATKNKSGEFYHQSQNLEDMQKGMLDYVSNSTKFNLPKSWPRLEALQSMEEIWKEAKDTHIHVALVFEDDKSYLGRQVILDLSTQERLLVRRMIKGTVSKYGIKHYPSLYLIQSGGTFQQLAQESDTRAGFVTALMKLLGGEGGDSQSEGAGEGNEDTREEEEYNGNNNGQQKESPLNQERVGVHMQDLESALHYSFRQEIAINKVIDKESLQALKDFILVLTKYFPGRGQIKRFLSRVQMWIQEVTSEVTGTAWLDKIDSLQTKEAYLPEKVEWAGCKGSQAKYRGYPCSLWTLFHTLTVSSYLKDPHHEPTEVLSAVAGYMKHFFGCEECRKNFLKMAATVSDEVKFSRDSVLWLWRSHNKANKRLHGDISEDPEHLKIQFPDKQHCPKCRTVGTIEGDQGWNEAEVLKYLLEFYRKENIIQDAIETEDRKFDVPTMEKTTEQLDWWERKQRRRDLEKIFELRQSKKRSQAVAAVHMQDLESALHYALRQEIAIVKVIDKDALQALKDFLQVLAKYFPGRSQIKKFLSQVHKWIQEVTSPVTGGAWLENINKLQMKDTFLPEKIQWVGCHGSKPLYRGYPCGMWTLYHTLTVNAYLQNKDDPHSPKQVLSAIAGYMKYFFGCAICREHFLKLSSVIDKAVRTQEDSVLLLWRGHNMANKGLEGDISEDPTHPKIQFPGKRQCNKCHVGNGTTENPVWNEDEVLQYLVKFYREEAIVQDAAGSMGSWIHIPPGEKSLEDLDWWERKQNKKDLENVFMLQKNSRQNLQDWKLVGNPEHFQISGNVIFGWGFSQMDIGMCVIFYIMCTIIILLLYYHFTVRRRMRMCPMLPL